MLVNGSDLKDTYKIKNKRAGVIVYTFYEGRLYFLLAVDRRTREYTDFGGGCKNNEDLLQGAWREFQEESCGVFSILSQKCLDTSFAVVSNERDVAIFFVEAPTALLDIAPPLFKHAQTKIDPTHKSTSFEIVEAKSKNMCRENISIEWIDDEDFYNIAFNKECRLMWTRIQRFLMKNLDYHDLKMKIAIRRAVSIPDKRFDAYTPSSCPAVYFKGSQNRINSIFGLSF